MPALPESDHALAKAIAAALRKDRAPLPARFRDRFTTLQTLEVGLMILTLVLAGIALQPTLLQPELQPITLLLGALGLWRFGWWANHALRAEIFAAGWPATRKRAEALWQAGWRPPHLHVLLTTYDEAPAITRRVLTELIGQITAEGLQATLWIGTGLARDEAVIRAHLATHAADLPPERLRSVLIRQNQPGKRMALGLTLRAMLREGVGAEDLVIFMDGDAVPGPDLLRRALSVMAVDRDMQALTTDERAITFGPDWVGSLLRMRFAQRRLAMQSHALSGRVLTLTGRFSLFRASAIRDPGFLRAVEADHLDHWLWGRFRFLSGDDKSTWYHLLARGARMGFVPDALVHTVEVLRGSARQRMLQNMRRWSGNMLRNGARAIALGPRRMPVFIWWCLVDQRLAIWTALTGPILGLFALSIDPAAALALLLWLVATRLVLAAALVRHAPRAELRWIWLLYANQVATAAVKVVLVFHLAQQRWFNRGDQRTEPRPGLPWREAVALMQMVTLIALFVGALGVWSGALAAPF